MQLLIKHQTGKKR